MKEVIITLLAGIGAAVAAYVLQGILSKSKSKETVKLSPDRKPKASNDDAVIEVQAQTAEQTERHIPKNEWSGGQR